MLEAIEAWRLQSGATACYTLLNFSPHAVPSIVPCAADLADIDKRYAGALAPKGPPPCGPAWLVLNHVHAPLIFVNNYGRHSATFRAVPTAFCWDWLGLAAPIAGIGCVTVNGAFLGWVRSTRDDIDACGALMEAAMGPCIEEADAVEWPQKQKQSVDESRFREKDA